MDVGTKAFFVAVLAGPVMLAGCDRKFIGGAAAGRISQEKYNRRKAEIEKRSIVY